RSSTPSAATAACSLPWALKPAAVCSETGSAADGTTAVIAGAAPACAAANRAVIDSTAALAAASPSGTTRSVMTHTPFDGRDPLHQGFARVRDHSYFDGRDPLHPGFARVRDHSYL